MTNGSAIIVFVLLMCLSAGKISCDVTKASSVGTDTLVLLHKRGVEASSRKLMGYADLLDYDTGPNPKHDPRGGKKGGVGSKFPDSINIAFNLKAENIFLDNIYAGHWSTS